MSSCHFRILILIHGRALLDSFRKNPDLSYILLCTLKIENISKIYWLSNSQNNSSLRVQLFNINFQWKMANIYDFPYNIIFCAIKGIGDAVFLKRLLRYCLWGVFLRWWHSLCKFWCPWANNAWWTVTLRLTLISEMSKCEKLYTLKLQKRSGKYSIDK